MADAPAQAAAVTVLGGGPAGATTALILARAGMDVVVFDRGAARHGERGEVLAPEGRATLARLGLWEKRPRGTFSPCDSTRVAWRSSRVVERSSITNPYGCGWRVCRPALDEWLLAEAEACGARVFREAAVTRISRQGNLWRLSVRGALDDPAVARVVVDATGRSLARRHWSGVARSRVDGLCVVLGRGRHKGEWRDLLVEACPDGWCYSIGSTDECVIGFVTDADVLANIGGKRVALEAALRASPLTAARVRTLTAKVWAVSIATTLLAQTAGEAWLAVGDAALSHDPLAGQGLLFALRSAIDAAHAVERHLASDTESMPRYAAMMRTRALAYLAERRNIYDAQPRWRDRIFWRRRSEMEDGPAHSSSFSTKRTGSSLG